MAEGLARPLEDRASELDGQSRSVWTRDGLPEGRPLRREELETDVCIVGGGIAGLSTAYFLAAAGKRVIVLDDGPLGGGDTCRTTAQLATALDARYHELERLHGRDATRLAAASHATAIRTIGEIAGRERIDCDFEPVDGYLYAVNPGDAALLESELAAAHEAGLSAVEIVERAPVASFDTGPALRFPEQAQFHVLDYLRGLGAAITRMGGEICTRVRVEEIEGGSSAHVTTEGGAAIAAGAIVVATGSPINNIVAPHTKQAAYRSFVVAARIPRGSFPPLLLWDTADPYHYVRRCEGESDGEDFLLVGGEDHKTGQANDAAERYARLVSWTRDRFPEVREFPYRWSGQVLEPVDGLAFIGRNPLDASNVFIVSGTSGNGMTYGTIAGLLLRDLILGRPNPWMSLYDPSRRTLGALGKFARENLNVAAQYVDLLTPGEVDDPSRIEAGAGAIVRRGVSKVAVYRDEAGVLHERTAICPHLGCVVRWNAAERTWDCPCHGSRFLPDGRVVNGPAHRALDPVG